MCLMTAWNMVGIVTDRDLVLRGIASKNRTRKKLQMSMTKDLITVSEDDSIEKVGRSHGRLSDQKGPGYKGKNT